MVNLDAYFTIAIFIEHDLFLFKKLVHILIMHILYFCIVLIFLIFGSIKKFIQLCSLNVIFFKMFNKLPLLIKKNCIFLIYKVRYIFFALIYMTRFF